MLGGRRGRANSLIHLLVIGIGSLGSEFQSPRAVRTRGRATVACKAPAAPGPCPLQVISLVRAAAVESRSRRNASRPEVQGEQGLPSRWSPGAARPDRAARRRVLRLKPRRRRRRRGSFAVAWAGGVAVSARTAARGACRAPQASQRRYRTEEAGPAATGAAAAASSSSSASICRAPDA